MYDPNNIFQKIINKDIPAEIIYEDEKVLAFKDINPAAPVHVLLIPKKNSISLHDYVEHDDAEIGYFFRKATEIAENLGLAKNGYRIITNHGNDGMQTVFHFHIHILGGKRLGALLQDDEFHA